MNHEVKTRLRDYSHASNAVRVCFIRGNNNSIDLIVAVATELMKHRRRTTRRQGKRDDTVRFVKVDVLNFANEVFITVKQ